MSKLKNFFKGLARLALVIIIIGGLFVFVSWFFSSREEITYTSPLLPVQTTKAEKRIIESTLVLTGYIEAESMIPVVPFVSGIIESYEVREGDTVNEGDLICQIDKEPYELQVAQARAASIVYEATYDRISTLVEAGAATRQQLDEVKAQMDAGKAQLDLALVQLGYTDVKAPVGGTILKAPSAVGGVGTTQSPVAVIADLDNLIVNIAIPEKYHKLIVDNEDNLEIVISRPASSISEEISAKASILFISPYIDPVAKSFNIRVKLMDNVSAFAPGMYIKAKLTYERKDVMALPISARNADGSVYYIDYSDGETRARYMAFEDGISDGSYFEIDAEYSDYEFIIRGQDKVLSGQRVEVVEGY